MSEEEEKDLSGGSLIPLAILFFPAILISTFFNLYLHRRKRIRPIVINKIILGYELIIVILFFIFKPLHKFFEAFSAGGFSNVMNSLIYIIIFIYLFAAGFLGAFLVFVEARQLKREPHRKEIKGNWMYKFDYVRTPKEKKKRQQTIENLQAGILNDAEKAPLGLDEENGDIVAYRYYEEASKHTLISGASGAGKALHKDTLIPTAQGMKKVDQIRVGDTLFDEKGNETKVLGKYQPMTKDHYELIFSDGTKIKACGDHLWEVENLSRKPIRTPRYNRILSNKQKNLLEKELLKTSDLDSITFTEIYEQFKIPTGILLRQLGNKSLKILSGNSSMYSRLDLITVPLLNSTKKINEVQKNNFINQLKQNPEDFISRSEILNYFPYPRLLTEMSRAIKKQTTKDIIFNKKSILQKILDENKKRDLTLLEDRTPHDRLKEVISTRDLLKNGLFDKNLKKKYSIPNAGAVEYKKKEFLVDPYVLGAWLGDGSSYSGVIGNADYEMGQYIANNTKHSIQKETVIPPRYEGYKTLYEWRISGLTEDLKTLGVIRPQKATGECNKNIPDEYLYGSIDQRLELLAGLLDTDGSCSKRGTVEFGLTIESIVKKVQILVHSLGWKTTPINSKIPTYRDGQGNLVEGKRIYWISFHPNRQVFRLSRKAIRLEEKLKSNVTQQIRHKRRYLIEINPINDNPEDYFCFTVDSASHLFLCTEAFIPTHNTVFTLLSLIRNDIENRIPAVIVDFKRDPELAAKIATWTKEAGGEFYHFVNGDPKDYNIPNSPGQAFFDPLAAGSPTSKADMVLGMREYDTASAVYKANMQQLLQVLFSMLDQADRSKTLGSSDADVAKTRKDIKWDEGGIYQLASVATASGFENLAIACHGKPVQHHAEELLEEIKGHRSQMAHALNELAGQIRTIVASEYGRWTKTLPGTRNIDLYELTKNPGNVILFSLNSDSEPDFAKYIGGLIFAELTNVSARRRNNSLNNPVMVYVDEFQIIPPTAVTGLLEKSRASNMGMTLAQQSFEQIISAAPSTGEAYLLAIMDTCSNFIIHNGATEDSAVRLSKILGKHKVTKYRASNKNESFFLSLNWKNKREAVISSSEEEEWVFPPRKFMTLTSPSEGNGWKSTAILINKTSSDPNFQKAEGATARRVWMIPAVRQLEKYYTPGINRSSNDLPQIFPVLDTDNEHAPRPLEEYNYLATRRREDNANFEEISQVNEDSWDFEIIEDDGLEENELKTILSDEPRPKKISFNEDFPPPSKKQDNLESKKTESESQKGIVEEVDYDEDSALPDLSKFLNQ
jgi:hypothetical protein